MTRSGNVEPQEPTAPELVLDLLVGNVEPLCAAAICRVGELFDLRPQVVRVAITRLLAQGKIERAGRAQYVITRGRQELTEVVGGWWQSRATPRAWRGNWIGVVDGDVHRQDKRAWRKHQLALHLRGLALLSPGLWVRPDNLQGGVAAERAHLQALGLSPQAVVVSLRGLDSATLARACDLWREDDLPAQHTALAAELAHSAAHLASLSLAEATRESLTLGRRVIAHLLRDPLLPPKLMDPHPREVLTAGMRAYQQQARPICRAFMAEGLDPLGT